MMENLNFTNNKSLWERFQDQKEEPWPFVDFEEYKNFYYRWEAIKKRNDGITKSTKRHYSTARSQDRDNDS